MSTLPPQPGISGLTALTPERMASAYVSTKNALKTHMDELASVKRPLDTHAQGNVLAIVRFPQDDVSARACDGELWRDVHIRMSYDKLMGLGSAKIRDMLSPKAQARFRRRLSPDPLLPGIEYVIDFTPPSEGPELADLTAALWLPRVVKFWFLAGMYIPHPILEAGQRMGIAITKRPLADTAVGCILTLGHDDVCKNIGCIADASSWQAREGTPGIFEENPPFGQHHIPAFRRIEDYCPIRHRAAIVRVLRGINGEGFLLNSAVRMWTVAQVAIYLEVPQVVVDPVAQWLVAPPNTKFIEICPEKAYQLAHALKIPSVLTAAFRILVNELAVDYAAAIPSTRRRPLTWAQRRRDDYGDYPSDPIEYASRSLADRMTGTLAMLQSRSVFDRLPVKIPEWDALRYLGTLIKPLSSPLKQAYHDLVAALLGVFHRHVEESLHSITLGKMLVDLVDAQRAHYIPERDRTRLDILYDKLAREQKALTPFFWDNLQSLEKVLRYVGLLHNYQTLAHWTEAFNTQLFKAISNKLIDPDPSHPSLAHRNLNRDSGPIPVMGLSFDLTKFHAQLHSALCRLCARIVPALPHRNLDAEPNSIPFFLSDHLLVEAIDEHELKYLPIWADGLDDGSGGVFQEAIPPAEMGPSEPGPGYHTGWTAAGTETDRDAESTLAGGGVDDGDGMSGYAPSTLMAPSDLGVGELTLDDDGDGDGDGDRGPPDARSSLAGHHSGTVTGAVPSSSSSSSSSSFGAGTGGWTEGAGTESLAGDEGSSVYADARFALPAAHQIQGRAIEEYVLAGEEELEGGRGRDSFGLEADSDLDMVAEFGEDNDDFDDVDDDDDDDGTSTLDGFQEIGVEREGEGEVKGKGVAGVRTG